MTYNFYRTDDYSVVEEVTDGPIYITKDRVDIFAQSGSVYFDFFQSFHCTFSEIGTINGTTPASIGAAMLLLGDVFKGFPLINVIVS